MASMSPCFVKMSGTGNSFLIIDVRTLAVAAQVTSHFSLSRAELAKQLCTGYQGTTADGLIFIENPQGDSAAFRWDFYNADGSTAEMCGNAARCVALFYQQKITPTQGKIKFESIAGIIEAEILDPQSVKVSMPPWSVVQPRKVYEIDGFKREFSLINTGVPHLVASMEAIDIDELLQEAAAFRRHPDLGVKGANVTYYLPRSKNQIEAFSFERGVEGFTLSCGTGAVAAALDYKGEGLKKDELEVKVRGGKVFVGLEETTGRAMLSGEARFLADIYFY